jgi:hypothetical protein
MSLNYKSIRATIKHESEFRAGKQSVIDLLGQRIMGMKLAEITGQTIDEQPVHRGNGVWTTLGKIMDDEHGHRDWTKLQKIIDSMDLAMTYSKRKEKFWRLVHNDELEDARRYDKKLKDCEDDMLERIMDDPEHNLMGIDGWEGTRPTLQTGTGEGHMLEMANEFKHFYDMRQRTLTILAANV